MKIKKRLLPLLLVFCLTGCDLSLTIPKDQPSSASISDGNIFNIFASEPILLCEEVDVSSYVPTDPHVFQSLHTWSGGMARTDDVPNETIKMEKNLVKYESSESVIDAYVAMLTENGFTLVEKDPDPYLCDYRWKLYCHKAEDAAVLKSWSGAHIAIEGYDDGDFYFHYSGDLVMRDLGLRMDGESVDLFKAGPSAGCGLLYMSDKSFITTDGRLSTKLGKAAVYRDGKLLEGNSYRDVNKSEWLMVNDYYRNEDFIFAVDAEYTVSGDYYWLYQFMNGTYYFSDDPYSSLILHGHGDNPYFLMKTNGYRHGPNPFGCKYESLFIRVLHYEEDVAAVYYVYAKLADGNDPAEIEALCAVDMTPKKTEDDNSKGNSSGNASSQRTCSACGGDGRCNMCGGSGRVNRWTGDSYVMQSCTGAFCSGGSCNQCGGDGKS